jgi:O-antigen/teichoic acid export membrane protein
MRFSVLIENTFGLSSDKLARVQRLGREFFWIVTGQAVAVIGSLVGVRLLTGVLSPDVYGELALGITLATLVNQIVLGPLAAPVSRFFAPAREKGELASFLTALRKLFAQATGIVLLIAGVVCLVLLLTGQFKWLWLGIAAFGFALLSGYNSILDGIQNAARQRSVVAWHQALASWGRFLMAVGMVLWLGATSTIAMLGYGLATLLVLISQFFFSRRILHMSGASSTETMLSRRWQNQMFTYAWPFAAWGIFTWALLASDRWALQIFASTRDVGLYAVLFQLGYYPISLLSGLMVQLVSPIFFQRAGDATDASRMRQVYAINWRFTMATLILTGISTLLAYALHGYIFRWLVAPEYRSVSWLLPGLVLSGGFFATGQFASLSLSMGNEMRDLIAPKIVTAIVGVLFSFIGAAWRGVTGVVLAGILFSVTYMIWIMRLTMTRREQFVGYATISIK